jgi:hypothetical protein
MMRTAVSVAFVLSVLAQAAPVRAESYTVLPNGDVVFHTILSTQGIFLCAAVNPCAGNGTSNIVIGAGEDAVAIGFTGINASFPVGNTAEPVTLGSFLATSAQEEFPYSGNVNVPILRFQLILTHEGPVPGTTSRTYGLGPGGGSSLKVLTGVDWLSLPIGANPPGYHYSSIVYSLEPFPFALDMNAATPLVADVGAVPEPGTLLLVASGLGLAATVRRRASRRRGAVAQFDQ